MQLGRISQIFSLLRARRRATRGVVVAANSSAIGSSSALRFIPPDGRSRRPRSARHGLGRALRARLTARLSERGSMAVEFVVVVPAFVLLLLLIGAGGQWVSASGQVDGAARDAAREASLARSPAAAQDQARLTAQADLPSLCSGGGGLTTNVTAMSDGALAPFATATEVQVRVTCSVGLAAFRLVGFPATQTFQAVAVAPLDTFVCRNGLAC